MTEDAGLRVVGSEFLQQFIERMLLGIGAGIGGFAVLVEATLIDDAEAAVVVVAGMHTLNGLGQQGNHISIAAHIVVVRALTILGLAAGYQVLHAEGDVALVCHAVDDEQLHRVMLQWFHFRTRITRIERIRRCPSGVRSSVQRGYRRQR